MKKRKIPDQPDRKRVRRGRKPVRLDAFIPVLQLPQSDGSLLITPGKPVLLEDTVSTTEAAQLVGMSSRWVIRRCVEGVFETAFKPGTDFYCHWRISRREVMAFIEKRKKALVE